MSQTCKEQEEEDFRRDKGMDLDLKGPGALSVRGPLGYHVRLLTEAGQIGRDKELEFYLR